MANSTFVHANDCGGVLNLDLSGGFSMKTPSLSISPDGIMAGVLELQMNNRIVPAFYCEHCQETVKDVDEINVQCSLCSTYNPVSESHTSRQINIMCEGCRAMLSGEKEPNDKIRSIAMYLSIKKGGIETKPLASVFKKKILF